jgi:hypothetical protein
MKPLARLIGRVTLREGAIVLTAMMVLPLSSIQTATGTEEQSASRSAKEIRGATPYLEIKNEPAPKLIVDPRFPNG